MANIINRQQTFSTNGTVTAAGLHNLIDSALVNSAIIKNQQEITTIGTADLLLIAPDSVDASLAPRKVTVQNLFEDGLTAGTFVSLNLTGALTYGTATGNRTVSTSATITTGTIPNLTSSTANITLGTIPTLTAGTTTGTAGIFTSGTVATLNSTTGTIGNLSTTLAGDFTISQGTGTLGTSGVTLGTYGGTTSIPVLAIDAKGRVTTASTSAITSGLTGFRNRIINGDMRIWQRDTSFSVGLTSFTYTADRFKAYSGNTSTTVSRSTSVPTGFQYSYKLQRPSGNTGTNTILATQIIETANCYDLAGQSVTLSFWVRSGANYSGTNLTVTVNTGTVADEGGNPFAFTGLATPISNTTYTPTATWSKVTFTGTVASNVLEAAVAIQFVGTGTAGADDSIYITGVQLEAGSTATDFERRPIGTETMLCQRYYEKSYNMASIPGASTNTNKGSFVTATGNIFWRWTQNYRVSKRADSTFTIYSTTGASGSVRLNNASDLAVSTEDAGENATAIFVSRNATVGDFFWWQWTASAEL
jgi:hypothetical protein